MSYARLNNYSSRTVTDLARFEGSTTDLTRLQGSAAAAAATTSRIDQRTSSYGDRVIRSSGPAPARLDPDRMAPSHRVYDPRDIRSSSGGAASSSQASSLSSSSSSSSSA